MRLRVCMDIFKRFPINYVVIVDDKIVLHTTKASDVVVEIANAVENKIINGADMRELVFRLKRESNADT